MSDWLGQRSGVASALAGLDQSQPGDGTSWANGISLWGSELSRSVLNGSVPVDRLNDMVTRTVAAWYKLGQDKGYPEVSFSSWTKADNDVLYKGAEAGPTVRVNSHINVQGNHKDVARAVAREGIVLLKHEDNVLPLAKADVIRVFGSDAGGNPQGPNACGDRGCNTGVLGMGWGVCIALKGLLNINPILTFLHSLEQWTIHTSLLPSTQSPLVLQMFNPVLATLSMAKQPNSQARQMQSASSSLALTEARAISQSKTMPVTATTFSHGTMVMSL